MKKTLLIVAAMALVLPGCASLENAGFDSYIVRASANGACCELEVKSGKEYAVRRVSFQADGRGSVVLSIEEGQAKAFKGQALVVKAMTILPVNGLGDILK